MGKTATSGGAERGFQSIPESNFLSLWYVLGIGAVGATAMPKSPYGIALIVSPILLWSGYAA